MIKIPHLKDLLAFLPGRANREWQELPRASQAGRPNVILVSGFGANQRNLHVIRRRFLRDGFNVVVISLDWSELSDGVRGLGRMAEKLSESVLMIKKEWQDRYAPVHIVAHSAGGLVARYYVQQLGGHSLCESLVTLATPHQGSWLPLLGFLSPLIVKFRFLVQLLPISSFIRTLNKVPLPEAFPLLSIQSDQDRLCPTSSTRLPKILSKSPYAKSFNATGLSHSGFLLNKSVYEQVRLFINAITDFKSTGHKRSAG